MIPRRKARFYRGQLSDIIKFFILNKAIKGDKTGLFEEAFAKYIGSKFAIATPSGKMGLELLLEAYNLQPGDEVIVPAYTLRALIDLIKRKGLVPRIADIDDKSFNMDPQRIEAMVTPGTKVILATHIFGLPCDMDGIKKVADKYKLKVVEDCAHATGSEYKGKKVGSGNDSFFSLEFIKNLNTFGGGMITTNDESRAIKIREKISRLPYSRLSLLKRMLFCYLEHFLTITPLFYLFAFLFSFRSTTSFLDRVYLSFSHKARSGEYRFNNLQAHIGLIQLSNLDKRNYARRETARLLSKYLEGSKKILPQNDFFSDSGRTYYYYVVRVLTGNRVGSLYRLRRSLLSRGVDCGIYSEITGNCSIGPGCDYENINKVYASAIQLPIFDGMSERQVRKISGALLTLSDRFGENNKNGELG